MTVELLAAVLVPPHPTFRGEVGAQPADVSALVERLSDRVEKARQIRPGIGEVTTTTVACPPQPSSVRTRTLVDHLRRAIGTLSPGNPERVPPGLVFPGPRARPSFSAATAMQVSQWSTMPLTGLRRRQDPLCHGAILPHTSDRGIDHRPRTSSSRCHDPRLAGRSGISVTVGTGSPTVQQMSTRDTGLDEVTEVVVHSQDNPASR